jgi:hypothetical protein
MTEQPSRVEAARLGPADTHRDWRNRCLETIGVVRDYALGGSAFLTAGMLEILNTKTQMDIAVLTEAVRHGASLVPPDAIQQLAARAEITHLGAEAALVGATCFFAKGTVSSIAGYVRRRRG